MAAEGTIQKLGKCSSHVVTYKINRDDVITYTEQVPYYECKGHCYGHGINYCTGHVDAEVSLYSRQDIVPMSPVTDENGQEINGEYKSDGFETAVNGIGEYYTITGNDDKNGYGSTELVSRRNGDLSWETWYENNSTSIRPDMAFAKWNTDWEELYGISIHSEYDINYFMTEAEQNALIEELGGDVSTGVAKARYEFVSSVVANMLSDDLSNPKKSYRSYSSDRFARYAFKTYADSAYLRGTAPLNVDLDITSYNHIASIDVSNILPGDVIKKNSGGENLTMIVVGTSGGNITGILKESNSTVLYTTSKNGCTAYRLFKDN